MGFEIKGGGAMRIIWMNNRAGMFQIKKTPGRYPTAGSGGGDVRNIPPEG